MLLKIYYQFSLGKIIHIESNSFECRERSLLTSDDATRIHTRDPKQIYNKNARCVLHSYSYTDTALCRKSLLIHKSRLRLHASVWDHVFDQDLGPRHLREWHGRAGHTLGIHPSLDP